MKYEENEIIEFIDRKYQFIGNSNIKCNCMSNGHKCDQKNLEKVESNPFIGVSDRFGYLCTRVWRELV